MPRISDTISINNKTLDKRYKLTDKDRENIKNLYYIEHCTIRGIAKLYQKICSRRLIQLVIFPERAQVIARRAQEVKRWKKYNVKEIHTPAMRKHRAYKNKLYKQGLL